MKSCYKWYYQICLFVVFVFSGTAILCAAGNPESAVTDLRISALNGPSGVALASVCADHSAVVAATGCSVTFDIAAGVDVIVPRLIKGETDIAVLPVQLAAKLYKANNGSPLLCAVTGNAMFYIASSNGTVISSLAQLDGKTVYCAGRGATPEYVMRFLLRTNGLTDRVTLDFSIRESELATALASGKIAYAVLPEPFMTAALAAGKSVVRGVGLDTLWHDAGQGDTFPVTALVVRSSYAKEHGDEVQRFLRFCESEMNRVITHPDITARDAVAAGINIPPVVLENAVPFCNFVLVPARDAQFALETLYKVFLASSPESLGGELPPCEFYYAY